MTFFIGEEHELKRMPSADSVSPRMAAYQARLAARRAEKWAENKSVIWASDFQLLRDLESLANYVLALSDCPAPKPERKP